MRVIVDLPAEVHRAVIRHLLPAESENEEAAFIFAARDTVNDLVLHFIEWVPIDRNGFALQSAGYLELADETLPRLIKRAHDLDACLIELHSHPYPWPAEFSPTDLRGLDEFVPHVRWRLKGKPYVAIVVAPAGFDALAWTSTSRAAEPIDGVRVGDKVLAPTGLTHRRLQLGAGQ